MGRTYKDNRHRKAVPRRISVRAVRRDPVDLRKLSRALIALAQAQAEADAAAADSPERPIEEASE